MRAAQLPSARKHRGRDGAYACVDGTAVRCRRAVFEQSLSTSLKVDLKKTWVAPRSGVALARDGPPVAVVCGMRASRDVARIIVGSDGRTCTFPGTVIAVGSRAFYRGLAASVVFNEGLQTLETACFCASRIRKLALSSSVGFVGDKAFMHCEHLERADLRAARGLKALNRDAFQLCTGLRRVLLSDGLEAICSSSFRCAGLEEVAIPGSVWYVGSRAFADSRSLRLARFLDAAEGPPQTQLETEKHALAIRDGAFADCDNLKQVTFGPASTLEEIWCKAFCHSGLESFAAPRSLRRIGALAFAECCALKRLELNEDIQELGWLCLWGTGVTELELPQQVQRTREQLGLDQDPKVLRLPEGLEVVGDGWFSDSDIERLIIPNTVKKLGDSAFSNCVRLREVVFESDSQLETIGSYCFERCGLREFVVPESVKDIGFGIFLGCWHMSESVQKD